MGSYVRADSVHLSRSLSRKRLTPYVLLVTNLVHVWQIEVYARENGLEIVGYYQANAAPNNEALGAAGTSIVEKIQAVCKHAFALVVCSRHLTPESLPTHVALEVCAKAKRM